MEHIYADLEKIICSKVEEFSRFLLQFQENFSGTDLRKIIRKKNELELFCTEYVHKEYPFDDSYILNGKYVKTTKSIVYFHSIKYMHNRVKELDKMFLEFLDKFIDSNFSQ